MRTIIRESGTHKGDDGVDTFRVLTDGRVIIDGGGGVDVLDLSTVHTDGFTVRLSSDCLLYTSPSPRDQRGSRMPSSA